MIVVCAGIMWLFNIQRESSLAAILRYTIMGSVGICTPSVLYNPIRVAKARKAAEVYRDTNIPPIKRKKSDLTRELEAFMQTDNVSWAVNYPRL